MEEVFKKNGQNLTVPRNYLINKNDFLEFAVFTNKGEVLIDPTSEFAKQIAGAVSSTGATRFKYLVQGDGFVNLPIIGKVKVDSITVSQCDSLLAQQYGQFYQDAFVLTRVINRRVFILGKGNMGGMGGMGGGGVGGSGAQIYELDNENITLMEILAKIGGPAVYSHAERIKVIRGDLKNPTIFTIDMTRWDSFQKTELRILPNDIIYIESGRRAIIDFLRDISVVSGLLSALLTIYLLNRVF